MFDSSTYQDSKVYAGDITVSEIKFGVFGEVKLPEGAVELPTEEQPTEEVLSKPTPNQLQQLKQEHKQLKQQIIDKAKHLGVYNDLIIIESNSL